MFGPIQIIVNTFRVSVYLFSVWMSYALSIGLFIIIFMIFLFCVEQICLTTNFAGIWRNFRNGVLDRE